MSNADIKLRGCPVCGKETPDTACPDCGCTTWDDPGEARLAPRLAKALSYRMRGVISPAEKKFRRKAMRKSKKQRLTEMLEDTGMKVLWISGAQGYDRIYGYLDDTTTVWDAAVEFPDGIKGILHSYDTMTDCVRYGIVIDEPSDYARMVWAKSPDFKP